MIRRLLSRDSYTGITRWFHDDGENVTIESQLDVEPLIDSNKRSMAATDERARWGDGKMVARIPTVILFDLVRQGILTPGFEEVDDRFRRWLNDPDNRMFRTRPGRI